LVESLSEVAAHDSFWNKYFDASVQGPVGIHLAVFVEPYLSFVLSGTKTVESRFSVNKLAPFELVHEGDVVLLKKTGGPIVGLCRVSHVWNFKLEPKTWSEIRNDFADALCAQDPSFWDQRKEASYATLMRVDNVLTIPPIKIDKRDRRGWVVLKKYEEQTGLAL